jgi:hypothetical protein
MSSIVISGDTSGAITVAAPAVSGTNTATLPAATGTIMVSGNMPAFSAWQSSAQSISATTVTKIQFQTEEFDTNNCFDNTTNYRFTPTVAGYYQVSSAIQTTQATTAQTFIYVYKNGANYKATNVVGQAITISNLVYLNGSTDYIEIYLYTTTGCTINADQKFSYFQASMVRAA